MNLPRKLRQIMAVFLGMGVFASTANATDWYVDVTKPCPGNGQTPETAWCQIWRAFGTQSCGGTSPLQPSDRVFVKAGTYEVFSFCGKAVEVIGKTTSDPGERIITHSGGATKVTFNHGEATSSILEGFIISGGTGVGITCNSASPKIRDCVIKNNGDSGNSGGGISLSNSSAVIEDCVICQNTSYFGGGIYASGTSYNLTISRCKIEGNTALGDSTNSFNGAGGRCSRNRQRVRGNLAIRHTR